MAGHSLTVTSQNIHAWIIDFAAFGEGVYDMKLPKPDEKLLRDILEACAIIHIGTIFVYVGWGESLLGRGICHQGRGRLEEMLTIMNNSLSPIHEMASMYLLPIL
jgi:hypothetical protein